MGRLLLALLVAISLFWGPVVGVAATHDGPGGCGMMDAAATPSARADNQAHHHQGEAPSKSGSAVVPCCLAFSPGFLSNPLPAVMPDDAGLAASGFVDDVARGRVVEPAERPPRLPFLPSV